MEKSRETGGMKKSTREAMARPLAHQSSKCRAGARKKDPGKQDAPPQGALESQQERQRETVSRSAGEAWASTGRRARKSGEGEKRAKPGGRRRAGHCRAFDPPRLPLIRSAFR